MKGKKICPRIHAETRRSRHFDNVNLQLREDHFPDFSTSDPRVSALIRVEPSPRHYAR